MQVFISWSGERSKRAAEILKDWLPQVIQAVEPWLSKEIEKGARWGQEVSAKLEQARVGIICLTPDNLRKPWILFEAGALAKIKDARPCTFLVGIDDAAQVEQPLGQFQATVASKKDDVQSLIRTINSALEQSGEKPVAPAVLENAFEMCWPRLDMALQALAAQPAGARTRNRSDREVLDEILLTVRNLARRPPSLADSYRDRKAASAGAFTSIAGRILAGLPPAGESGTDAAQRAETLSALAGILGKPTPPAGVKSK